MNFPDTNGRLSEIFENGALPTMVYINKQDYERKTVLRPLHRHTSICEMLLIYQGEGYYHVEGETYPLSKGSVIFYNQGDLHEVIASTEKEIGSFCIGITNLRRKGMGYNQLIKKEEACVKQANEFFSVLYTMCEQMYQLEGTTKEGRIASQLLCASFIAMTCQMESFSMVAAQKTEDELNVLRIKNYLNQNFMYEISLEAVAEKLGYSVTYISHVFKKATGRTPIQYVIRRRIGHAQTLLISTNYSATQIAGMVGYDNTNYFSTLFSKIVGMSPTKYREFYKEEMKGHQYQS